MLLLIGQHFSIPTMNTNLSTLSFRCQLANDAMQLAVVPTPDSFACLDQLLLKNGFPCFLALSFQGLVRFLKITVS